MTTMRGVKRMCVAAIIACSVLLSISASGYAGQGSSDSPQQNCTAGTSRSSGCLCPTCSTPGQLASPRTSPSNDAGRHE